MPALQSGILLVASPTMKDPNFARTVVLLCAHGAQGSFGLVINRPTSIPVTQLIPGVAGYCFQGGPVSREEVSFLHQLDIEIDGTMQVASGIHFGGEFTQIKSAVESRGGNPDLLHVYLGYAGWGGGQLDEEVKAGGWIICRAQSHYVFAADPRPVWQKVLSDLGAEGRFLASLPLDPEMN